MPNLLPIWVVPPVSACTDSVRVQGQLRGSTITIFADDVAVGEGIAQSSDALIRLTQPLLPGQKVLATQTVDTDTSPKSTEFLTVQSPTSDIGVIGAGPLSRCASCMLVFGVLPGANATVRDDADTLRGESDLAFLTQHVPIDPASGPDERLHIRQETQACGAGERLSVEASGTPPIAILPPKVTRPLKACQWILTLSEVVPGAMVTIERSSFSDVTVCLGGAGGSIALADPLVEGETIRLRQFFPECGIDSPTSEPITVGPVLPLPTPDGNPADGCKGTTFIHFGDLKPGATIELYRNATLDDTGDQGELIGQGEVPPESTLYPVPITDLGEGDIVSLRQGLCGFWSDRSPGITILETLSGPAPNLEGPLFECGLVVRANMSQHGQNQPVTIVAHSEDRGGEIGRLTFTPTFERDYGDILVSPPLSRGDRITLTRSACGEVLASDTATVQPAPPVSPPRISPVPEDGDWWIHLEDVIPGAMVEVTVETLDIDKPPHIQSAPLGGESALLRMSRPLEEGDILRARQRICHRMSQRSDPISVVIRSPIADFSANPVLGQAPLEVSFTNHSQFANDPQTPFEWIFDTSQAARTPNGPPDSTGTNPTHTYAEPGNFGVQLTARNELGATDTTFREIQVLEAPEPNVNPLEGDNNSAVTLHAGLSEPTELGQALLYSGQIFAQPGMVLARIAHPGTFSQTGDWLIIKHDIEVEDDSNFPEAALDEANHVRLQSGQSIDGDVLMEIFGGDSPEIDLDTPQQVTILVEFSGQVTGSQIPTNVSMFLWIV